MAQYYQLAQPNVSSISVDGVEHKADLTTGVLTVEMLTPNLLQDLRDRGAVPIAGPAEAAKKPDAPPPLSPVLSPSEPSGPAVTRKHKDS